MKQKLSLVSQVAYQLYTASLEFQKLAAKKRDGSGARGQGGQGGQIMPVPPSPQNIHYD